MNHTKSNPIVQFILAVNVIVILSGVFLLSGNFSKTPEATTAFASSVTPNAANIFVGLAKKAVPSVVNISTFSSARGGQYRPGTPDDFFRFFEDMFRNRGGAGGYPGPRGGGDDDEGDEEDAPRPGPAPKNAPRAMSLGTGFIIDSTGLILTNNHVVAEAEEIKIIFTEDEDEKPTDGQVVGRDPELDLALIRVKTNRQLVPLPLGDSDTLEVGEYVMAVGNPFGQGHSVTHGIISAKQRRAPDFQLANYLQTDAPINPGNSGGPLVNLKGEVIGINNAIHQGAQGIGFAIPISLVKTVLPQLRSKGSVSRGYIGVGIQELTPQITTKLNLPKNLRGPIVTEIRPGEPADKAGLKPYDVILEFNGKPVKNGAELVSKVTATGIDQSVPIKVWRKGGEQNLTIKISQRPNGQQAANKEPKKNKKDPKKAHVDTGMEVETLDSQTKKELGMKDSATGIVVTNVAYGGAADRSGLMRGDVIIEVDTKTIKDEDDFYSVVKEKKSYLLRVRRVDPRGTEVFQVVVLDFNKK